MNKVYQYCFLCGSKLKLHTHNLYICTSCKLRFYINPKPTNGVILLTKTEKILLARRRFNPQKGLLDLPGGFIDIEETVEESIQRELKEELGIKAYNLKFFKSYTDRYLYNKINYYILSIIFTGTLRIFPKKPGDDIESIEYYSINKIPFEEIAFTGIKKALQEWIKSL